MSIITLFGGFYCNVEEVAGAVARRLGCQLIPDNHLLAAAAKKHTVPENQLAEAVYGSSSFFKKLKDGREYEVACVRDALANCFAQDNVVYHGFATHLVPRNISHVLRVCLVADKDYLVQSAMNRENAPEKEAKSIIKKDGEKQREWVRYLLDREPWDEDLYDIVIPFPANTVESAVDLICENAQKDVLAPTAESRTAANDFLLTAKIYLLLAKKWPWVDVLCRDGEVALLVNKMVVRWEHLKKELTAALDSLPGVKSVQCRVGPKYKCPPMHPALDFEMPSKVLLVDDEKEFVQTLSERLLARNLKSELAYNGEEALSQVERDEPEVMVLDMKMPGIDGLEVLRRIKRERPNVEVIILTGHGSESDRDLAEELGAFAYLEKPVEIDVLTQTMKEAYQKIFERKSRES